MQSPHGLSVEVWPTVDPLDPYITLLHVWSAWPLVYLLCVQLQHAADMCSRCHYRLQALRARYRNVGVPFMQLVPGP